MQKERTIVVIGEPRVEALPPETADFFYTTLLTRIRELIQHDNAEREQPQKNSGGI